MGGKGGSAFDLSVNSFKNIISYCGAIVSCVLRKDAAVIFEALATGQVALFPPDFFQIFISSQIFLNLFLISSPFLLLNFFPIFLPNLLLIILVSLGRFYFIIFVFVIIWNTDIIFNLTTYGLVGKLETGCVGSSAYLTIHNMWYEISIVFDYSQHVV